MLWVDIAHIELTLGGEIATQTTCSAALCAAIHSESTVRRTATFESGSISRQNGATSTEAKQIAKWIFAPNKIERRRSGCNTACNQKIYSILPS
jgi:hypothetical protein